MTATSAVRSPASGSTPVGSGPAVAAQYDGGCGATLGTVAWVMKILLPLGYSRGSFETRQSPPRGGTMVVEEKLRKLGLVVPDLEEQYRQNASGAHFVSHLVVGSLLYLT